MTAAQGASPDTKAPGPLGAGGHHPLADLLRFAVTAAQFALLVLVVRHLGIESPSFHRVLMLAFAGFLVHHLLPARLRMPFFAGLSVGAALLVLGVDQGVWQASTALRRTSLLVGAGSLLIGICHLPFAYRVRMGLLLATGAAYAWLRVDRALAPELGLLWPVLGSMFMFRLLVYAYDLAHAREPARPSRSFAYFFMLPNVCFPLFPIVDYKTFCRSTVPDEQRFAVYQTGLHWMFRGVVHLMLYRFLADHLAIDPARVETGSEVARFVLVNSFLYLRVSGQFHLVVGLLRMFGFALPETNRLYFLAESFTDYWRRVNVYWKDFILKLFYYPSVFRLKRWGQTRALVAATAISFFATFLLHSYQWFWLRGSFAVTWQDTIFWGVLAVLVTINSLREARHGRARQLGGRVESWRDTAGRALRTGGTFATVSLLWSLWGCASLADWLRLWTVADGSTLALGGAAVVAVMAVKVAVERNAAPVATRPTAARQQAAPRAILPREALACGAVGVLLYAAATPGLQARLGPGLAPLVAAVTGSARTGAQAAADRGYYEQLMDVDRFNPDLFAAYSHAAVGEAMPVITRPTDDFRLSELVPSRQVSIDGVRFSTNALGMRDREYAVEKAPDVVRVAVLGSSHVMGYGVSDEEVFEALVEERLNRDRPGGPRTRYEVLNFAVNGYSPLAQLRTLDAKVPPFSPDVVLVVGHSIDAPWITDHLLHALATPDSIPYPPLRALLDELSLGARTLPLWARSRLAPHETELLAWTYREMVSRSRALGALPVYVFLGLPLEVGSPEQIAGIQELAREAGFVVVDLSGVYEGHDPATLKLAAWNDHSNARAHALVAEALYRALLDDPRIGLGHRVAGSAR